MANALWIAKTGLDAQQSRMAIIANNLANVNTTGYKYSRPIFNDLLYQTVRQPGAASSANTEVPSGLLLGTGVRTMSTQKFYTQGSIIQTENPTDIGISGKGFFEILLPDGGAAYTRDGTFQINSSGNLVTSNGFQLQPAVTIPANSQALSIGEDGIISVVTPGATAPTQIGALQLADFVNPAGLQPIGDNLVKETAASGAAILGQPGLAGIGRTIQGALENSNVNVVAELVNMIETQRAYEMNSKAISTSDQMLQFASQNL
jgi:flagellar basal-body rod protein FlgG